MTEYCATQAVTKFYRSPGLCTYEELTTAEAFLLEYRKLNRLYIEASGDGPHTQRPLIVLLINLLGIG